MSANFRHRRQWVLRISILPLNFSTGDYQPQSLYFSKKLFGQVKIWGGAIASPSTMPLVHAAYEAGIILNRTTLKQ